MRLYIKTSEVTFEFEDHTEVKDCSRTWESHKLPSDTNKWIKEIISDVLKLHQEIYNTEKEKYRVNNDYD